MAAPRRRRISFVSGTWRGRKRRFRPDRFLVKLKDDVPQSKVVPRLTALLEAAAGEHIPFRADRFAVIRLAPGDEVLARIDALRGNQSLMSEIDWLEPDFRVTGLTTPTTMPDDPLLTDPGDGSAWQWGMVPMGMGEAWARQRGSSSVFVVIVDNGFEVGHPDLSSGRFLFGGSFLYIENSTSTFTPTGVFTDVMPEDMTDLHGHGVALAGVIAADCDNGTTVAGMNWASPIGICRALDKGDRDDDSVSGSCSTVLASVLQALEYAKKEGVNLIVNLSLELSDSALRGTLGTSETGTMTFQYMCKKASEAGALLVCAGGNDGSDKDLVAPASYATWPDFQGHVIAVGFTCQTGIPVAEPVYLPSGEGVSSRSHQNVTVVAPGYAWPVLELGGGTDEDYGSSIAAAHATGLASLIWSHRPDLTAAQVIDVMKETAEFPSGGAAAFWGSGRINAYAALRAVEKRPVISLVLDTSGSMASGSGTPGMTRLQVLQGAADILLHVTEGDSHVGIVQFSSAAAEVVAASEIDAGNPALTQDALTTRIDALTSNGMTGIGSGVEAGVAQVLGVADGTVTGEASRAVILMTDGRENSGPRVNPGPGEPALDLAALAATGIPVYGVGTGDTSAVDVDALMTLAGTTGGEYAVTGAWSADSEQQIAKFFCQVLAEVGGFTSLLDPSGVLTRAAGDEVVDFAVCRDEQRLEAILMKPEGAPMGLALETPDGVEIDADMAKLMNGLEYRESDRVIVMRVILPCMVPDRPAAHAGTWRAVVRVTGGPEKQAVPYTLIVNARSRLRIEARMTQDGTKPPSTANVVARLLRDGRAARLRDVHAKVTVHGPDGSKTEARLAKERGWFAGRVALPKAGAYRLEVRVTGRANGSLFAREKLLTAATWTQELDPGDGRG
ncbi:MAG: S8 family serine peptidase [Candidatus Eiseniibacteriota bacterium]